jgi:hypothetical protein
VSLNERTNRNGVEPAPEEQGRHQRMHSQHWIELQEPS